MTDAEPVELVNFIDALGRRVTLVPTRQNTAAIFTRSPESGLSECHPELTPENMRELGEALIALADRSEQ